jgi:hypothetical protein
MVLANGSNRAPTLPSSAAGQVYTLKDDKSQLDKLAGQNVAVKGKVVGTTNIADSIATATL